jgi:hypothetical protein
MYNKPIDKLTGETKSQRDFGEMGLDYLTLDELRLSFTEKQGVLLGRLELVDPRDFYRDFFPKGDLQEDGRKGDGKPCGIIRWAKTKGKRHRAVKDSHGRTQFVSRFLYDDLKAVDQVANMHTCFLPLCSFIGKRALASNARWCPGFAIDLDYVDVPQLLDFLHQAEKGWYFPTPNYVVNSGTGLHVYYRFPEKISLSKIDPQALSDLKHIATDLIWNAYTSKSKDKQYQGIYQAYRMPGTTSKLGTGYTVTAFRMSPDPVAPEDWASFVGDDWKELGSRLASSPHIPIAQARELWPEWYEERIVRGVPSGGKRGKWHMKRDLYDWWLRRCEREARDGNRYSCIKALRAYGAKCDIPFSEVERDAFALQPFLDSLTANESNHFTEQDVIDALRAGRDMERYPVKEIKRTTGLDMTPSIRRNGRRQDLHLKRARRIKAGMIEDGEPFRNPEGRPKGSGTKEDIVRQWRREHPEGNKSQCARGTGLSRVTVTKWWDAGELERRKTLNPTRVTIDLSCFGFGEMAHVGVAVRNNVDAATAAVVPIRTGLESIEVSEKGANGLSVRVVETGRKATND